MVKKLVALSAVLVLTIAGPASAGDGYADEDTTTVSDSTVTPGQPVTVTAKVFEPGSTVTFTFFSAPVELGTAVAGADGVATLTFDVPATATAGTHTIEASGTGADGLPLTVSTTITVVGAAAGGMPTTGSSNTVPLTRVALATSVGGGLLVLAANKRRSARVDARELTNV